MISTKARYALRVMLDLAQQPSDQYIPLKAIAQRQQISEKYLEIILKNLVKAQFLKGVRGKGGGYMLTKKPEEYLIGEIIELTDGPLVSVACNLPGAEECQRKFLRTYYFKGSAGGELLRFPFFRIVCISRIFQ